MPEYFLSHKHWECAQPTCIGLVLWTCTCTFNVWAHSLKPEPSWSTTPHQGLVFGFAYGQHRYGATSTTQSHVTPFLLVAIPSSHLQVCTYDAAAAAAHHAAMGLPDLPVDRLHDIVYKKDGGAAQAEAVTRTKRRFRSKAV